MNKLLLLYFVFITAGCFAQEATQKQKNEDYDLFISGGCHIGLWALVFNKAVRINELPYNVHVDKALSEKYAVGIGYSYDMYDGNPLDNFNYASGAVRQNIRLRFCKFLSSHRQTFCPYIGASLGVSCWKFLNSTYNNNRSRYWPTAQFLFGIKVKLSDTFFWQTEFGAGPPYAFQTSLGIKF